MKFSFRERIEEWRLQQLGDQRDDYLAHCVNQRARELGQAIVTHYPLSVTDDPAAVEVRLDLVVMTPDEFDQELQRVRAAGHRDGFAAGERNERNRLRCTLEKLFL